MEATLTVEVLCEAARVVRAANAAETDDDADVVLATLAANVDAVEVVREVLAETVVVAAVVSSSACVVVSEAVSDVVAG